MSEPLNPLNDLDAALAGLRAEQTRIRAASDQMNAVTGSSTSKDRMISATVDSRGRLVDLKLKGTRYRQLAPAELTARIAETVREAQDSAARTSAETLAGLLPPGLGLPVDGEFDLDAMFEAAVGAANLPMFDDKKSGGEKERNA
ncbi:MAG: YbaB/EbfC family nucleoid-associated protein [Actinoallomurus sp.]